MALLRKSACNSEFYQNRQERERTPRLLFISILSNMIRFVPFLTLATIVMKFICVYPGDGNTIKSVEIEMKSHEIELTESYWITKLSALIGARFVGVFNKTTARQDGIE